MAGRVVSHLLVAVVAVGGAGRSAEAACAGNPNATCSCIANSGGRIGYNVTNVQPVTGGATTVSDLAVGCDVGYIQTADPAAACDEEGGDFTFTGCGCGSGFFFNEGYSRAAAAAANAGNAEVVGTFCSEAATSTTWTYVGCFQDNSGGRDMGGGAASTRVAQVPLAAATECAVLCAGGGFSYFGLQWVNECFCDNSYNNGHGTNNNQAACPDGECSITACDEDGVLDDDGTASLCSNGRGSCGGRNAVYSVDTVVWSPRHLDINDLAVLPSPRSGDTSSRDDAYKLSCGGNGKEAIFYLQLQPWETLDIGMTENDYDSRHETSWGGTCPGQHIVACTDNPDTGRHQWTNQQGAPQNVFFVVDAFSTGSGTFELSWSISFEADETACQLCPIGSQSNPGATAVMQCETCAAGRQDHDFDPTTACQDCAGGSFRAEVGPLLCADCPADTYAAASSAECHPCPLDRATGAGSNEISDCKCKEGLLPVSEKTVLETCIPPDIAECASGASRTALLSLSLVEFTPTCDLRSPCVNHDGLTILLQCGCLGGICCSARLSQSSKPRSLTASTHGREKHGKLAHNFFAISFAAHCHAAMNWRRCFSGTLGM